MVPDEEIDGRGHLEVVVRRVHYHNEESDEAIDLYRVHREYVTTEEHRDYVAAANELVSLEYEDRVYGLVSSDSEGDDDEDEEDEDDGSDQDEEEEDDGASTHGSDRSTLSIDSALLVVREEVEEEVTAGDPTGNDEDDNTHESDSDVVQDGRCDEAENSQGGADHIHIASRAAAALIALAVWAIALLALTQTDETSGGSHDTGV